MAVIIITVRLDRTELREFMGCPDEKRVHWRDLKSYSYIVSLGRWNCSENRGRGRSLLWGDIAVLDV